MKHILLYLSFFFTSSSFLFAQDQPVADHQIKKEEKIRALYVAYITQQLNLNEEEAKRFWPLHGQFDTELKGAKPGNSELDRQQELLNIKKRYQDKFSKILGIERTDAFYRKDGEFRKKMVERLYKMRQQKRGNQGNMRRQNF